MLKVHYNGRGNVVRSTPVYIWDVHTVWLTKCLEIKVVCPSLKERAGCRFSPMGGSPSPSRVWSDVGLCEPQVFKSEGGEVKYYVGLKV